MQYEEKDHLSFYYFRSDPTIGTLTKLRSQGRFYLPSETDTANPYRVKVLRRDIFTF